MNSDDFVKLRRAYGAVAQTEHYLQQAQEVHGTDVSEMLASAAQLKAQINTSYSENAPPRQFEDGPRPASLEPDSDEEE